MRQTQVGQRAAQSHPLGVGVDAEDVALADRLVAGVAWRVHLRPVRAEQVAAVVRVPAPRQEEARRVEPALLLAQPEVLRLPPALLGVRGERAGVDPEPGALVPPGPGRLARPPR